MVSVVRVTTRGDVANRSRIAGAIDAGREFVSGGGLSGAPGGVSGFGCGRLPEEYHSAVGGAEYVVFSYGTPVAWRGGCGVWVVPDVSYSVTTSRHQGLVRVVVGV